MRGGWGREVGRVSRLGAQLPTWLYIYSFGWTSVGAAVKIGQRVLGQEGTKVRGNRT